MAISDIERQYLETARIGRLATTDSEGRPHVVPICFTFADGNIVTSIDEKPKGVDTKDLRRVRDIRANPRVALVVDHYTEDWTALGWIQVRGTATLVAANEREHESAIRELRAKYDQYADHRLEERPIIRIQPGHVVSWGQLDQTTS